MPRVALMCVTSALLAACNVGEGNKPEALRFITSATDTTTLTSRAVFQCFTQGTLVIADFTDGIPGDFTSRVSFSSDNPAVLRVSNGDIVVPGSAGLVYNRGVLVPVSNGVANVKAEFAGLVATLAVTVRTPDTITVSNELMTDSDGTTRHAVTQMAPGSSQQLVATAVLFDGSTTSSVNVSALGDWVTSAPLEVATIGPITGFINALTAPATPTVHSATVSFAPCSGKDGAPGLPAILEASELTTTFEVRAPARNLVIVTEPGYPANDGSMVNGSSQFLRVLADFDTDASNGEGQDLTFKGISYGFAPTGVLSFNTASGLLLAGSVPAGQASNGPAAITASLGSAAPNQFTSDPLRMSVTAATLDSVAVTPATATIAPLASQQFKATGAFTVGGFAAALTQPVNHDVSWTSSDSAAVFISNFTVSAGLATSLLSTASTTPIAITAQSSGLIPATVTGTFPSGTATLNVSVPVTP